MRHDTTFFVHRTGDGFFAAFDGETVPRWTDDLGAAHPFYNLDLAVAVARLCGGPSCHVGVIATVPLIAGPVTPERRKAIEDHDAYMSGQAPG